MARNGCFENRCESPIAGHARGLLPHDPAHAQPAAFRQVVRALTQRFRSSETLGVSWVADVETEHRVTGNDIARAGLHIDLTDRGRDAAAFHREDEFRRRAECIAAQIHGRGSGVSRTSDELDADPALSRDAADRADREALPFEHRSLFDVNFNVSEKLALIAFRALDALLLDERQITFLQRAGKGATPEVSRLVPHSFFVREADNLDMERQLDSRTLQPLDYRETSEHAKGAVIFTGITHSIEVRAE